MKKRAAVIAVVLGFMGLVGFASNRASQNSVGHIAVWNLYVPQSCAKQALIWTQGREHFDNMPLSEFLKLKSEIEGCGGKIGLAEPTKG